MGVMNLMPWGGPTIRVATVLGMEANDLWRIIIPIQIVGIIISFVTAIVWARIEIKRGAGLKVDENGTDEAVEEVKKEENELARPKLVAINGLITLIIILSLVFSPLPSYLLFMLGTAAALMINYPGSKLQGKVIKAHSAPALMMASTLLTAGVFLGLLNESGMMDAMAVMIAGFLPEVVAPYLHIIMGLLSAPLALIFSTDSFFYGLLPVMNNVGTQFGVDPLQISITMLVAKNCVTMVSPLVPAVYLGCGLAGVELKDLIKTSFMWLWGVSIICMISGFALGILTF